MHPPCAFLSEVDPPVQTWVGPSVSHVVKDPHFVGSVEIFYHSHSCHEPDRTKFLVFRHEPLISSFRISTYFDPVRPRLFNNLLKKKKLDRDTLK